MDKRGRDLHPKLKKVGPWPNWIRHPPTEREILGSSPGGLDTEQLRERHPFVTFTFLPVVPGLGSSLEGVWGGKASIGLGQQHPSATGPNIDQNARFASQSTRARIYFDRWGSCLHLFVSLKSMMFPFSVHLHMGRRWPGGVGAKLNLNRTEKGGNV